MNTPVCDFVNRYINENPLRLHMPGHKGNTLLGFEEHDITEVEGADSLYEASGIIKESEQNASEIFGCNTYYSTEGSSQCIRAMLYLATVYAKENNRSATILAGRNAHKTFVTAAALLDLDVMWLEGEDTETYLSCNITPDYLDRVLSTREPNPVAVYLTNPDYLGNMVDVKRLAEICNNHNVLLLVDNAHGAYLKFLNESQHPIDLGAHICCDSAHKTLPVLTGGAYLHISNCVSDILSPLAKDALSVFGSTSPSYLILESLDMANKYMAESIKEKLDLILPHIASLKEKLVSNGYKLVSQEILKITIATKSFGYTGEDFAQILKKNNITCEFSDPDYIVLMLSCETTTDDLKRLSEVLLSIPKFSPVPTAPPSIVIPEKKLSIREALLSTKETVNTQDSLGRVLAATTVGCPPAVPIIVCGEIINENTIELFKYYNIKNCVVVK